MTKITILYIIIAVLLLISIVSIILKVQQNKKTSALADSINDFIQNGKAIDFSVNDNEFARLHNSVSDLINVINTEKANTLNETKRNTEFISDVSHQLKTPIAALRLYCEMENAAHPNEHTEKELQLIEKMENLVQNLLKLEKIRSDTYAMDFQFNDVDEMIHGFVGEIRHLFPNKKYIVTGKSRFRCDKIWLSEALGNIIKNASEHTPDDGIIEVKIDAASNSTIIEIQDNGGGIDDRELPNLFTRFFRTEKSLPTSAGIGLAITKAIVEKHHGIISAENKNNGLCITICFPHLDGYVTI